MLITDYKKKKGRKQHLCKILNNADHRTGNKD